MKISKRLFLLACILLTGVTAANAQSLDLDVTQSECPYQYYNSGYCGHVSNYRQIDENECPLNILEGIGTAENLEASNPTTEQMVQEQLEIVHEWELVFWNSPENPEDYFADVQVKEAQPLSTEEVEESLMVSVKEQVIGAKSGSTSNSESLAETFTTPDFDYYDYIARAQSALNAAELDGVASVKVENSPQPESQLSRKALLSAMAEVAQLKEDEAYLYAYDGLDPYGYEEYNCYFELSEAINNCIDLENESFDYTDDEAQITVTPPFSSSTALETSNLDPSSDEFISNWAGELGTDAVVAEEELANVVYDNSLINKALDILDPLSYIDSMDLSCLPVQVSEVLEKGYLLIDLDTIEALDRAQQQVSDYRGKILR